MALMVAAAPVGAAFAAPAATLYSRLGGHDGVEAIANSLIDRAAGSPALGRSFQDSNLKRIKRLLAEQLCELSGGPCRYSGDSMHEVHAGHHITQAEFYGLVDMLRAILAERHVDLASTNQLLRLLAPMKRDIVEHAASAPSERAPRTEAPP
jgi:hemoglobin